MTEEIKKRELNEALEFLSKPTAKRVRLAADILIRIILYEGKNFCYPCNLIEVTRYKPESKVQFKKHICTICPNCGGKTFDLNTEIMQGSCLSCAFISSNYKQDMQKRNRKVE